MTTLNSEEYLRYRRHFTLPLVGVEGQLRLKKARVLCVGAGGLGSPLLLYLAAAGVGTLGIVDDDRVDASNLQRQVLYNTLDIDKLKAECALQHLKTLNPFIQIHIHPQRLTADNALALIKDYDIVADGTDNFATRYFINDACFHLKKPNVFASVFQFEGQCSVFTAGKGPCYRCLYDAPPPAGLVPDCAEGGVLGVLPGIMGSIQAMEVIKLILDIGEPLIGRLLSFDALSMTYQEFKISRHPSCRLCYHQQVFADLPRYELPSCQTRSNTMSVETITPAELKQLQDNNVAFVLLDVREPNEFEICHLNGTLIPLAQLPQHLPQLDKNTFYVVHCKLGMRSHKAVEIMKAAGFKSVKSLAGGIEAWARTIDPSMATY